MFPENARAFFMAKDKTELPEDDDGLENVEAEIVDDELEDEDVDDEVVDSEDDELDDDSEEGEEPEPWWTGKEIEGFDESVYSQYESADHFQKELVNAHRKIIKAAEEKERQYQAQLAQFQQQQQRPAPEPPKDDKPKRSKLEELREQYRSGVPEWKPEYERLLKQDETGQIVAIPGADPTLPQKYLQYQEFLRNQTQRFITDPHGFLEETILPAVYENVRNEFSRADQSSVDRLQNEQIAHAILSNNAGWMVDPQTRTLTPQGQQYGQMVQTLESHGMSPIQADDIARRSIFGPAGMPQQPPAQPAASPTEKRDKSNTETLKRGAKKAPKKQARPSRPRSGDGRKAQGEDLDAMLAKSLADFPDELL